MPNGGYFTKEKWLESNGYLKEVDELLRDFSIKYKLRFDNSCYHDWPYRNISWKVKSTFKNCFLKKTISLSYEKEINNSFVYGLGISVVINYGLKELLAFVPYLSKFRDNWYRSEWVKSLIVLNAPFDKEKLITLFEQAKQALDNFDETKLNNNRI